MREYFVLHTGEVSKVKEDPVRTYQNIKGTIFCVLLITLVFCYFWYYYLAHDDKFALFSVGLAFFFTTVATVLLNQPQLMFLFSVICCGIGFLLTWMINQKLTKSEKTSPSK